MPWWIWLLLALFMLAMIIAGFVYAGLHGYHALKDLGAVGHEVGKRFARMEQTHDGERQSDPPLFTQPLTVAKERYVDAHADVVRAKAAKRERHARAWARWKQFNN